MKKKRTHECPLSERQLLEMAGEIMAEQISEQNLQTEGCLTTSEVARGLNKEMRAGELLSALRDFGVLHKHHGHHELTPEFANRDLARTRHFNYFTRNGELRERPFLVWTKRGREFIENLMMTHGKNNA